MSNLCTLSSRGAPAVTPATPVNFRPGSGRPAAIGLLTEALALVGGAVNEDLGGDDVAEGYEHLHELAVAELLGQVVDEEVATFGS